MKKYLLPGFIVLFSLKALAHIDMQEWAQESLEYDKQKVIDEIPALFAKTSDQYPELKGVLEPDIESIQLNMDIPHFLLKEFNRGLEWGAWFMVAPTPKDAVDTNRFALEMDVIDTESEDLLKLKCQMNVKYDPSTGSFSMKFFDASLLKDSIPPCHLTYQEEDDGVPIFHNLSLNPNHEFQNQTKRQRLFSRFGRDTT